MKASVKKGYWIGLVVASSMYGSNETAAPSNHHKLTINEFVTATSRVLQNLVQIINAADNPSAVSNNLTEMLTILVTITLKAAQDHDLSGDTPLEAVVALLESQSCSLDLDAELSEVQAVRTVELKDEKQGRKIKDLVLATLASMLGNIANIFCDPRNPRVVGPNIAQIFIGVLNVAREASKKSCIVEYDAKLQEQLQDLLVQAADTIHHR